MNKPDTASAGLPRRPRATDAARLQQFFMRQGFHAILFFCGLCAWVFKLKGDGSAEGGMLPYSPLQVLIPLLGIGSLVWLIGSYGRAFPPLTVARPSAWWVKLGIVLIALGTSLHLNGDGGKEAALFIVRWLLPVCFILFFTLSRAYGASPQALLFGLVCGAALTAFSVEAVRRFGVGLPISAGDLGRDSGYLNGPNQYGILCSTTSPILLFFFHSRRRWLRIGSLLLLPLYLLCLFQNLSKTNIILFFLTLFAGSLALSMRNPRKLAATAALAAGLAAFLALTLGVAMSTLHDISPKAAKTLEDAAFNPAEAKSLDYREGLWGDALEIIRARPIAGLGPGKTLDALGIAHAHNMLLQLYLDAGFAGLVGMCFVTLAVLWRAAELLWEEFRRRAPTTDAQMLQLLSGLALVTYVSANSMSDSFSTATMPVFMFFAALAFSPAKSAAPQTRHPTPFSLSAVE